ncbi:MAG: DUF1854 domain-containing protein [Abditibacteriales bacterium]|nr:DUF1854 domain-containing protein [Abditibacteriales bacterium]MDW8367068.1 DUF1854 domain-containing protein [Abditibacteriales bacterium]
MSTQPNTFNSTSPTDDQPLPPIEPKNIRLSYAPQGGLRLRAGDDRVFESVQLYRVAPLSQPNGPVAFLDEKGNEICTLRDLSELEPESRRIAEAELARRYLTARIQQIIALVQEAAVTYWTVETHRGRRDFVVQGLQENCVWLTDDHLLLIDVDGNRFEIPSIAALDARSQRLLNEVI